MELDVSLDKDSLSIPITNPFKLDAEEIESQIEGFVSERGASLQGLDVKGLLPKLVRGIAGCEGGCPADAMGVVRAGYRNFKIEYVEGGILTAKAKTSDGTSLSLKMFPDF